MLAEVVQVLGQCLNAVMTWIRANKLNLNHKTEVLSFIFPTGLGVRQWTGSEWNHSPLREQFCSLGWGLSQDSSLSLEAHLSSECLKTVLMGPPATTIPGQG